MNEGRKERREGGWRGLEKQNKGGRRDGVRVEGAGETEQGREKGGREGGREGGI